MALPKSTPRLGSRTVENLLKEIQTKILQADVKRKEAGGQPSAQNKAYVQALQEAREMLQDVRVLGAPAHKLQEARQAVLIDHPAKHSPDTRSSFSAQI